MPATPAPTLTELAVPTVAVTPFPTPFPSSTPFVEPTATTAPTADAGAAGSPTAEAAATATGAAPSSTPGGPTGTFRADFVADVTVPDGTVFEAGEQFIKTWKLKNAGTAPWGTDFCRVQVRGDTLGAPVVVPLSGTVRPGETVELSLPFTAPDKLGTYTSCWMLRTPSGAPFGIGTQGNQPIYVEIVVGTASGTPQPTAPAGSINVTAAGLTVDTADFTGACPHTFVFSASFTSEGAGDVTYQLEALANDPAFTFTMPAAIKSNFTTAGPRPFSVSYELQFTNSVSGQIWLHILTPNDLQSDKLSFSLTCQP
ncbi:MAG TPA: NBR1-Ig-like domain-containing protein [Chloroflexia bacterium]|nr:NBR1-Ig-like domain-containing protein [Chloroflexia bacterium]